MMVSASFVTRTFSDKRVPQQCLKDRSEASAPWFVLKVITINLTIKMIPTVDYNHRHQHHSQDNTHRHPINVMC